MRKVKTLCRASEYTHELKVTAARIRLKSSQTPDRVWDPGFSIIRFERTDPVHCGRRSVDCSCHQSVSTEATLPARVRSTGRCESSDDARSDSSVAVTQT
jgi:hypothetical protein